MPRRRPPPGDQGEHRCHFWGCWIKIPERWIFCKNHWSLVPRSFQHRIARGWKPGLCCAVDVPNRDWVQLVLAAVYIVSRRIKGGS